MAWAATIRVKLAELTLVERILRKIAPMKPHAQLCHEFAFVLHRPRREALAAETQMPRCGLPTGLRRTPWPTPSRHHRDRSSFVSFEPRKIPGQRRRPNNAESPTINADPNH